MALRRSLLGVAALVTLLQSGCAGVQQVGVSTDVALQRVVLYRNGVGYFERSGRVEGDTLRFHVRREHVGDFLATLAVIDAQGQARSVSFPSLEPDENDSDLVEVELRLGGSDIHDLTVAYVVETPIWRPSYRVVMGDEGALLQGWAVVQNHSGEDWSGVQMSVTSGAPLSFRSDLGEPVIPPRPLVTDTGEVVQAAVYSETALARERVQETPPSTTVSVPVSTPANQDEHYYRPDEPNMPGGQPRAKALQSGINRSRYGDGFDEDEETESERFDMTAMVEQQAQLSTRAMASSVFSLAQGAIHEGISRYDVTEPVTVPDTGSTMVAIVNETIPCEDALLFRPDPAVSDSAVYPMRVVRLQNNTGVLLERGPVAIYQTSALLGQGLLDPLPTGATTSIPFAIERAVAVTISHESDQVVGRLLKVASGRLTVEEYSQRHATYKVRNGAARATTLYIRHERMTNWEIVEPPEGTEEVENASLLPVPLEARTDAELTVLERTPVRRVVDLLSDIGAQAVTLYLEGPAVDAAAGPVLRQAMEHREQVMEIRTARRRLAEERHELLNAAAETRANLEAIRRIARARDLRNRLTRRLSQLSARTDELTNQIVELDAQRSEMEVRLSESLRDLSLDLEGEDNADS